VWSWGRVMAYASGSQPGGLAPWVTAATATDPEARPTAVQLRAAMATDPDRTQVEPVETIPHPGPTPRAPTAPTAPTKAFTRGQPPGPDRRLPRRRLVSLASAVGVVAAAAAVGAIVEVLAAVIVATVLVLVALAAQFRRGDDRPRPHPSVPPTWSIALASPVVLGASLAAAFGPLPGIVATVVVVVLFVLLTDLVT
jgi:hypothetical protein